MRLLTKWSCEFKSLYWLVPGEIEWQWGFFYYLALVTSILLLIYPCDIHRFSLPLWHHVINPPYTLLFWKSPIYNGLKIKKKKIPRFPRFPRCPIFRMNKIKMFMRKIGHLGNVGNVGQYSLVVDFRMWRSSWMIHFFFVPPRERRAKFPGLEGSLR